MERSISSDLIRGHIDTIILHALLDEDKFAQRISDSIEEKSESNYKINQATLYSSLKRLESLRYVKSYWFDSPDGRRKYFSITDLGKTYVDENLANWSYSRNIIDKLMDCEPTPIIKTEYVMVKSEQPQKNVQDQVKTELEEAKSSPLTTQQTSIEQIFAPKLDVSPITDTNCTKNPLSDVDYKNTLASLMRNLSNTTHFSQEISPIEKENVDNTSQQETKIKFNDEISAKTEQKQPIKYGKIDYSDLHIKAAKEGYKLRVSSKTTITNGKFLINKLNLVNSLLIFAIIVFQLYFINSRFNQIIPNLQTISYVALGIFSLYPIISLINFIKSPKKVVVKVSSEPLLVSFIVTFNLLLITFAINLLLDVDFNNLKQTMYSLYLPILLYANVVVNFLIRFLLSKLGSLKLKKQN